jgi:hypothetical protein
MSRQRIANVIAARADMLAYDAWLDVMEESLPEIDAWFVEQAELDRANASLPPSAKHWQRTQYEQAIEDINIKDRDAWRRAVELATQAQHSGTPYSRDRQRLIEELQHVIEVQRSAQRFRHRT